MPNETKQASVSTSVDDNTTPTAVTTILADDDVPRTSTGNADEQVIVALGYKQEFKREFSLWTTFCVSFAVLGLLPSFGSTLAYGTFFLYGVWVWLNMTDSCRDGICWHGRNGLGMDYCHGFHPVYCHGYGGALLGNAY